MRVSILRNSIYRYIALFEQKTHSVRLYVHCKVYLFEYTRYAGSATTAIPFYFINIIFMVFV